MGFALELLRGGELATVTLNEPERRNCQSPVMWLSLLSQLNGLPGSVRIVLVQAEGPSFSAGLDRALLAPTGAVAELAGTDPVAADSAIASYQDAFSALRRPSLVSIALIQGHAMGAGFQLALACDLRIAASDAVFTMAETSLGLVPDLGGTKRLTELVGYSRAVEICLTGRGVPAEEALRIGLVNTVAADGDLTGRGAELVATLLGRPRTAVIETKALLLSAAGNTQHQQECAERQAQLRQLRELAGFVAED